MKEKVKECLMIILKKYKENKFNEEEVLTLIETIIGDNETNTITYPISIPDNPCQNPQPLSPIFTLPFTMTATEAPKSCYKNSTHI